MTSSELRDYATVLTAILALSVFVLNWIAAMRSRRIENISRFNESHQSLFGEGTYLARHINAIETGTLQRDLDDPEMEARFHLMLLAIERLAILANNDAVPRHTQVYMFGSYARNLLNATTAEERSSMTWELALGYLEGLATDTETYQRLTQLEREKYWR